ncbi:TRM11 family SAM-dependent methyltransferase [Bacillus salitolerans]|uniref:TRM11 family SAM-dependent methyltransferase n=1 Tax=Bacillus salitolerans TaxID=1437434 RepID=A0ABW4LKP0_9BACI
MMELLPKPTSYLYTYASREEEASLCQLELRSLFNQSPGRSYFISDLKMAPSRSPFIRERIDILFEGTTLEDIIGQINGLPKIESSYRVVYVKNDELSDPPGLQARRAIEREVGVQIKGEPDLHNPKLLFGIMNIHNGFVFGFYVKSEAVWLQHQQKPYMYSTALSTRVARAVANIAVPIPEGTKAIDPCCGIGTVLIEALSMGIDIIGGDKNPLVTSKARVNIAHFGLEGKVLLQDIRNVMGHYDVAIIDLPYNLCSVITPKEQLEMFQSARKFAQKLVVVTIEPVDSIILEAGFTITDRCEVSKGSFKREVIVCK